MCHLGFLIDKAAGDYSTNTIYDDLNPDQLETLPDTAFHRNVDLEVLRADREGYVKTHIILPSTIYRIISNVLVDQGIQNPQSIQVPDLIRASPACRRAGTIGAGKNFWPNVNIDHDALRTSPASVGHGREGLYFGENGEHTLAEVGRAIGEALVALGRAETPDSIPFTKEEFDKYFGGSTYLGTNSRANENRARALGWKPKKTKDDFLASIRSEVDATVEADDVTSEGKDRGLVRAYPLFD